MTYSIHVSVSRNGDGDEVVQSLGEGIEREVFHLLMEGYRSQMSKWLIPRADGHCSLATTQSMSTAHSIPASRIHAMEVFGGITAMSLLRGVSASPLDPVVLHFFIHDCNIHSIHPQLLGEWHPTLKQTIAGWLHIGPHGDISAFRDHFATYHDLQVRCIF